VINRLGQWQCALYWVFGLVLGTEQLGYGLSTITCLYLFDFIELPKLRIAGILSRFKLVAQVQVYKIPVRRFHKKSAIGL
jgi:hypothetical protein